MDEDIRPVTEFRENAAALIRQVQETKRALVLTQRGHSAAVLLDVGEYERLVGELELRRQVEGAEQELAAGKGLPHERVAERITELARQLDRGRQHSEPVALRVIWSPRWYPSWAARKGALVMRRVRRARGGHDLRALVQAIGEGYDPGELTWGPPADGEVWQTAAPTLSLLDACIY